MTDELLIAEVGSVHDGSFGNACKLVELAAACGADVVKFQTHIAGAESLRDAPGPSYFQGEPRYQYFERTGFRLDQWKELVRACDQVGIRFLSSPFSLEAVALLEEIGAQAYKVPSGEVTNIPLIERLAGIGKPVLLSSGMSSWGELDAAVQILRDRVRLVVMQCTSLYPCPFERVGLNLLSAMRERYGDSVRIGFSDHTQGIAAGVAAAALGATVIEKHLTFSKAMYGSDAPHAMEPSDFGAFCSAVKETWAMLAHPVDKDDVSHLADMKRVFEKSLVAAEDVAKGSVVEARHFAFKKPGDGIPAARYLEFVGRRWARSVTAEQKLEESDFI